jgi:hypothetical protein
MMSGMPLETCWAFNKFWNNKFYYKVASDGIFLLIRTTMHGSMDIKVGKQLRVTSQKNENLFYILSEASNYEFHKVTTVIVLAWVD